MWRGSKLRTTGSLQLAVLPVSPCLVLFFSLVGFLFTTYSSVNFFFVLCSSFTAEIKTMIAPIRPSAFRELALVSFD